MIKSWEEVIKIWQGFKGLRRISYVIVLQLQWIEWSNPPMCMCAGALTASFASRLVDIFRVSIIKILLRLILEETA